MISVEDAYNIVIKHLGKEQTNFSKVYLEYSDCYVFTETIWEDAYNFRNRNISVDKKNGIVSLLNNDELKGKPISRGTMNTC